MGAFSGKTVSIVGAAQYLDDNEFGEYIDSSDIVVRINMGVNVLNSHNQRQLGTKANVLYHHLLEDPLDSDGKKFGFILPKDWKLRGVDCIYCLPSSSYEGICSGNFLSELVDPKNVEKILAENIDLKIVDYRFYNSVSSKISCKANTGFMALMHILFQDFAELNVFGFSFLLDGWYDAYHRGYENLPENVERNKTYDDLVLDCFYSKRHNQLNQWKCAKEMLLDNPKVNLDPILHEILSMKTFDRAEFQKILENYYEKTY